MKATHTPGPWTSRGGLVLVGDESNSGNVIAIVNCGGKGGLSLESKAIEANAHLISAAPDLLNALLEIQNTAKAYKLNNEICQEIEAAAQAAIKKAAGQ